jgi:hypothetical protein
MMSIKPGVSVADTKGISERISWRSGTARTVPDDPAVLAAVSGERLTLPVSVGTELQPKSQSQYRLYCGWNSGYQGHFRPYQNNRFGGVIVDDG